MNSVVVHDWMRDCVADVKTLCTCSLCHLMHAIHLYGVLLSPRTECVYAVTKMSVLMSDTSADSMFAQLCVHHCPPPPPNHMLP